MSDLIAETLICAVLPHGETNAVVRGMTSEHGLLAGYVRGARTSRQRALLIPGNKVRASWRARVDDQLGTFQLELIESRALIAMGSRTQAAALTWLTSLCAAAMPERIAYPAIYESLDGALVVLEGANLFTWAQALARFELTLLAELGFGLDLGSCVATGVTDNLVYVSPKSAHAVSRAAGAPYAERLLPLPGFLQSATHATGWQEIRDGLRLSGYFLEKHLQDKRVLRCLDARQQLMQLLAAMQD